MNKVFFLLVMIFSSAAWADGYDYQTPEEIAAAKRRIQQIFRDAINPKNLTEAEKKKILDKYKHLDAKKEINTKLLEDAILYFEANKSKFSNQGHMGIIDFKIRSDKQRFFVVDIVSGKVQKFYTAHGMGSDRNDDGYAEKFSNVPNSWTSSLGFARTGEVYSGKFKRSLRLDGLSTTNSKIRERAIVVHGWDWVVENPVIQGLSLGCPALDWKVKDSVIDKIKEGALLYFGLSQ
jgi:hypothetical protein